MEVTVKKGQSLWKIAEQILGSGAKWRDIYELNKAVIKNPNLIYPGQILRTPATSPTQATKRAFIQGAQSVIPKAFGEPSIVYPSAFPSIQPSPAAPQRTITNRVVSSVVKPAYAQEEAPIKSTGNAFLDKVRPYAEYVAKKYNLPASAIMAQAALESGFGKFAPSYNYFGIKGYGPAGTSRLGTWEISNGERIRTTAGFRAYENPQQSFEDYAKLITTNPRYSPALKYKQEPINYLNAIRNLGYATDPDYARKAAWIIKKFNL
jgi:flagellar protein FlgJ